MCDEANKIDRRKRFFPFDCGVKGIRDVGSGVGSDYQVRSEREVGPAKTPAEVVERSGGKSDRWAVVLFNDSFHSMDYVIWALVKTFPDMSTTEATLIMIEAHNTGKGVAALCGREEAIRYRDSLRVLQLGCDVEPGW